MTSILIRLSEGCTPPTQLVLPENAPIVATLLPDIVADPLMDLFKARMKLVCVTAPDQDPPITT
jgi:hypothetical protein